MPEAMDWRTRRPGSSRLRAGGSKRRCGQKHSAMDGNQEEGPAPGAAAENMSAEKATCDQHQEQVDEVEIAHGLQGSDADERGGSQKDHGQRQMETCRTGGEPARSGPASVAALRRHSAKQSRKPPEGQSPQPLVPGPLVKEVVGAGVQRTAPGRRGSLEDPTRAGGRLPAMARGASDAIVKRT